jgi:hypothetical protein
VTWQNLFNECDGHEGIKLDIIGNKGYLLMPWLMVPHKQIGIQHTILEILFNK